MKPNLNFCKYLLAAALMFFVANVSAQQTIRYVHTKTIDRDGVVHPGSGGYIIKLSFSGDYVHMSYSSSGMSFPFKFHHNSSGNSVYYQWATNYTGYGQTGVYNEDSILMISSDKNLVNHITIFGGRRETQVFKRQNTEEIERMYE